MISHADDIIAQILWIINTLYFCTSKCWLDAKLSHLLLFFILLLFAIRLKGHSIFIIDFRLLLYYILFIFPLNGLHGRIIINVRITIVLFCYGSSFVFCISTGGSLLSCNWVDLLFSMMVLNIY